MKHNIIIAILMLFAVGTVQGQELQVDTKTIESGYVKFINKDKQESRWPVINDSVTIESDTEVCLGKIRHKYNPQSAKEFAVLNSAGKVLIKENSNNVTDSTLTVQPGLTYFVKNDGKVKLTIIVKAITLPTPPIYDISIISEDSIAFLGDTLIIGEDGVFNYEFDKDSLLTIASWPTDYTLILKRNALRVNQDNRLCGGDTIYIDYPDGKSIELTIVDSAKRESGNSWLSVVIILLAILSVMLLITLIAVRRKKNAFRRNAKLMRNDLLEADNLFDKLREQLSLASQSSLEDVGSAESHTTDTLCTTNDASIDNDNPEQKQSEASKTGEQKTEKTNIESSDTTTSDATPQPSVEKQPKSQISFGKVVLSLVRAPFKKPKLYDKRDFDIDDITQGITSLQEKAPKLCDVQSQIKLIKSLLLTKDKNECETIASNLGEIGGNILSLKRGDGNYKNLLRALDVSDYGAANRKIQDLQSLNSSDDTIVLGNTTEQEIKSVVTPTEQNDVEENKSQWNEVEQLLTKKNLYNGGALEVTVHQLLSEFLDANYFRKMLRDTRNVANKDTRNAANKDTLNIFILETLGIKAGNIFPDANGNSKEWVKYLIEKFDGTKEPTEEQKKAIIDEAILEAIKKDASKSEVLSELLKHLKQLLRYESDKGTLSDDNFTIQTLADLLNSIPRSDDESRQKGAEEILSILQLVLNSKEPISRDDIEQSVQDYVDGWVDKNADNILMRDAFKAKVENKESDARRVGTQEALDELHVSLSLIAEEANLSANAVQPKIAINEIKQTLKKFLDKWSADRNAKNLEKDKKILLENQILEEAHSDIAKYKTYSPLISKLAKLIEKSKEQVQEKSNKNQQLQEQLQTEAQAHVEALKEAERVKGEELAKQKEELDKKIKYEKDGRKEDNEKWEKINATSLDTIKGYHLRELSRIKKIMDSIDGQLRSAYSGNDRNTPLGKLIDRFIRRNTFYSLDKFLEKVKGVEENASETSAEFEEKMRTLYKECLSLTPPTWIDVLARLYCYTDVPFIAEEFEKANLDCQAIRHAFFQMENLLRDTGITISYPRLFKDKVSSGYDIKPERNIDNYVSGLSEHVNDRQTIIDLYTVGHQIADEEPKKPVVSTF